MGRRDLTTDMSLNLQLEESTVRSERMTPLKFSTAHVKVFSVLNVPRVEVSNLRDLSRMVADANTTPSVRPQCSVGARSLAVSRGRDPRVQLLPLTALTRDPLRDHMDGYPGPLVRGRGGPRSPIGL